MPPRRKVEVNDADGNAGELSSIFLNAANDLSQLYAQALNLQKIAFDAGEKHALAKLNQWVQLKLQEGRLVTVADIYAYLQEELNNSEPSSELRQAWGTGSQQSGATQNRHTELDVPSSADLVQTQCADGNTHGSRDRGMEI